jgi:hypothetical protein
MTFSERRLRDVSHIAAQIIAKLDNKSGTPISGRTWIKRNTNARTNNAIKRTTQSLSVSAGSDGGRRQVTDSPLCSFFLLPYWHSLLGEQLGAMRSTDEAIHRQLDSLIESERAFLIVHDVNFRRGEPTLDADGLDLVLIIKNVGKHVGLSKAFAVKPGFYTNPDLEKRRLPEMPNYDGGEITKVIPPLVSSEQTTINLRLAGIKPPPDGRPEATKTELIKGTLSGEFPMRIFGFIKYDLGFSESRLGETGYCFEYIPESKRTSASRFETCNSPNYTYAR